MGRVTSEPYRVTLLNPKGGSGKTTIATSLASYYASLGFNTTLYDYDAQGSSSRWLASRSDDRGAINGVAAYKNRTGMTRTWQLRLPPGTERVIVDTPAGIDAQQVGDLVRRTDTVLIPVLPSRIDIEAVGDFVETLCSHRNIKDSRLRVALVANRVRRANGLSRALKSFLAQQPFPFVAALRESSNYLRAVASGCGIHELDGVRVQTDRDQWAPLIAWIEAGQGSPPSRLADRARISG